MADSKKDFERGDITWVEHPIVAVKEKKRGQRRATRTFKSRIPRILRSLAPTTVFDPHVAWKKEREAHGAAVATSRDVSERERDMIGRLDLKRAAERYDLDAERIQNKMKEGGITALLDARSKVVTKRGELELMLEILRLAAKDKPNMLGVKEMTDPVSAMDVMWALRENSLFKQCMEELEPKEEVRATEEVVAVDPTADIKKKLNEIMSGVKKMNIGAMEKECKARNIDLTGVKLKKDVLTVLIRKQAEEQLAAEAAAPPAAPAPAAAAAPVVLRPEALMVQSYRDSIAKVDAFMRADPDITVTQLTSMAHLLPPLSPFYQMWKLDEWQKKALRFIDDNKSVLICAPTSSGKTVISSYVASMFLREANSVVGRMNAEESSDEDEDGPAVGESRVLFVVPTEPLVWQVAAHFAKFLSHDTKVALVTEQMSFTPASAQIVVGTPAALESAMTKIRGKDGSVREAKGLPDGSVLIPGFNNYRWAVYDEVHSLNSETPDGAALQRLIRMVNCPFLHLSATVGNAETLRSWLCDVRGDHRNIEIVEAPPEEGWEREVSAAGGQEAVDVAEQGRLVKKIVHEGRFINLQRHVWASSPGSARADHLELLSPLSAISTSFLQEDGFRRCSLPMTPLDAYNTFLKLKEFFPLEDVRDLEPKVFFAYKFEDDSGIPSRLTLKNSKEYEDAIKAKLVEMSRRFPDNMTRMLSEFVIPESPRDFDSIRPRLATADSPAQFGDLTELIWKLKSLSNPAGDMLPALVFHLDMFELIERFKSLLSGLEVMQRTAYPNMHRDLQERVKKTMEEMQHVLNEAVGDKEKEEVRQRYEPQLAAIDIEQPHQDFVLSRRISMDEIKDIIAEMKDDKLAKGTAITSHALIRGLRRGIAIVTNQVSFQAYRRSVLRLAMQGKLAVVFSDISLAYGVNMPFRSCVFCGDMGGQLDALMLQQMSGRAGRRGMDTQGHLIYAGTSPRLINDLTLGVIPAITGVEHRYHTQNLQFYLSRHAPARTREMLSRRSLAEFAVPPVGGVDNWDQLSRDVLLTLNMIIECRQLTPQEADDEGFDFSLQLMNADATQALATPTGFRPNGRKTALLWMVWELRTNLPESLLAGYFLPLFLKLVIARTKTSDYGQEEEDQFEFMALLMMLINRTPCAPGKVPLSQHPWVSATNNKRREELRGRMTEFSDRLGKMRDTVLQHLPRRDMVMFPLAGDFESGPCVPELDGTFFAAFYAGNAAFVPHNELHSLMSSIWHVGTTLLKMHNALWPDTVMFGKLRFVISKCHARLNYLVREILTAHIDVPNVTLPDSV